MADDWIWVGVLILLAVIVVLFLHFFKKWAKPSQPHGQYQQHQLPLFTRPTTSFPDNVISRDGMKIGTMQDAGTIAPEEAEDCATLLTRAETLTEQPGRASQQEQQHGGFDCIYSVWEDYDEHASNVSLPRASSVRSTLSQQPEFQFDENLSQIPALDEGGQYSSQPSQHGEDGSRGKVSRLEAVQMMRKAAGLAEAAMVAVQQVIGDDLQDLSGEDMQLVEGLLEKIRKRMQKLRQETKKYAHAVIDQKMKNPDSTFLSLSGYDELQILQNKMKNTEEESGGQICNDKGTQTEEPKLLSKGVQSGSVMAYAKPFDQLIDATSQKQRSNYILAETRRFALGNSISFCQAVGYLLHRQYYNEDKRLASLGRDLFQGNTNPSAGVPVLDCLWILARNNLGKLRYTNLRLQLLKHVKLKPYSYLSDLKLAIAPQLHPWPQGSDQSVQRGVYADLGEAVCKVLQRMIRYGGSEWIPSCTREGSRCANLIATVHCSADGRGDEKQYNQRSQVDMDTSHVMSFVFSIPSITLARTPSSQPSDQPTYPMSPMQSESTSQLYLADSVLPELRLHHAGFPSKHPTEDEGVRVWTVDVGLEQELIKHVVPVYKRLRVSQEERTNGGETETKPVNVHDSEGNDGPSMHQLAMQIRKPLGFQQKGPVVWADREPQSSRAQHPWVISCERETADNVRHIIQKICDPQIEERRSWRLIPKRDGRRTRRKSGLGAGAHDDQMRVEDLAKPVLLVAQPCGHTISIATDISLKGLDTKMIRGNCGRTGAFCYLCTVSRADAHKLERVQQGFICDMSCVDLIGKVKEIFGPEIPREDWDIYEFISEKGDEDIRFGMKHAPYSTIIDTVNVMAVLHTGQLRLFGWVEQLFIRLASNTPWMKGRLGEAKGRKESAEKEWKSEKLGRLIGFRDLKAPNQVTGNMVKVFFSEEKRPQVVAALASMRAWQQSRGRDMTEEEKQQISCLLQRFNVINRVMSSDEVVKIFQFRGYCLNTYEMILNTFPEAAISEGVHRLLGHVWEFLVLNENCGLLRQGEGGSEALHKVERQNRQYGSRKTSIAAGNDDMFRLFFGHFRPLISVMRRYRTRVSDSKNRVD